MTPSTKALLESLPLSKTDFIQKYGENVLKGMSIVGSVKIIGDKVHIASFGQERLKLAQE
jgi:hypothetical protein